VVQQEPQLYQRICAYELDDPSHEIGFLAQLMRANGWSRPFALRAIGEYRKFVFLALVADHQVTPSDQVDQVWHLHLLFSEDYWNDFCPRVLGRPLHHQPTRGGKAERDRFHEQYRATIRSYRQSFGEPPADLWPPVDVRFGRDLQMQRGPIRRPFRPWVRWRWPTRSSPLLVGPGLMACGIATAAAGARSDPPPANVDLPVLQQAYQQTPQAVQLLLFFLPLLGLLVAVASLMVLSAFSSWLLRPLLLQPSSLSTTPQLDDEELAYLCAGPTRMLELGLASLVQAGVLRADPDTRKLVREGMGRIDGAMPGIAKQLLMVNSQLSYNVSKEMAYTDIVVPSHYEFKSIRESLQSQGLLLQGVAERIAELTRSFLILMGFVVTFSMGGFLLVPNVTNYLLLILSCCLMGFGLGLNPPNDHTLWGDAVLKHYQRASTHADPLQRVALFGLTAIGGGRLDDLRNLIENVEADAAAAAADRPTPPPCASRPPAAAPVGRAASG
jgi:uncharacterized protein (TIGR04222 family)